MGGIVDLRLQGIGMTSQRTRDRLIQRLMDQGVSNARVLEVMGDTPRHLFLDEALAHRAYEDTALPIGFGQTLSQPYIVARMTEVLVESSTRLKRVLEIGTGSGYQTAVLSQVVENVLSVERIKPLQEKARARLRKLQVNNVVLRHSDGHQGWPDEGEFDGILTTAAPRQMPEALLQQLAPGGVLVIPIGGEKQMLTLVKKDATTGEYQQRTLEEVKFVPLVAGTSTR